MRSDRLDARSIRRMVESARGRPVHHAIPPFVVAVVECSRGASRSWCVVARAVEIDPMDGTQFDRITKALAGRSRRAVLKGGAGALLGGALAGLGTGRVGAAPPRRIGEICRKGGDCASGLCLPKDATGRQRCGCATDDHCPSNGVDACGTSTCQPDGTCVSAAPCADGECCHEGVCRSPGATLIDCEGLCDYINNPANVTICGQTVACPNCEDCSSLGCDSGSTGSGPAGDGLYCVYDEFQGSCNDPAACAYGQGCFGGFCRNICTGA